MKRIKNLLNRLKKNFNDFIKKLKLHYAFLRNPSLRVIMNLSKGAMANHGKDFVNTK